MTIMTESLVLPKDIQLTPVATLSEKVQNQLDWSDGDVAITRLSSRTPSKVINADFASLVNEFQNEKTIVEAIMHYSLLNALDPHETLQNAYPILQQFVKQGFLVPPHLVDQQMDQPLLRGDRVAELTVLGRVRSLQDTEIYQAKTAAGETAALKIKQSQAHALTDKVLQHEADILQMLAGSEFPCLLGQGEWQERPFLAIEWCAGVDVTRAARELHEDRQALLHLCLSILDAYANLHAQGICHGDIHPGNILIDGDGSVHLIDFGLAHSTDLPAPYRGGVAFYYEPEYASAFHNKQRTPTATFAGEQYALAVLLYQLITGNMYLNFSLEESVLYEQITSESPLPFSEQGVQPWPEVEAVLARALAKNPEARFATVAAFADALRLVAQPQENEISTQSIALNLINDNDLVPRVIRQLQISGDYFQKGLPRSPFASINYGAAGVAYALYRMACTRQQPQLLALADLWLTRAEEAITNEAGFYNPELDLDIDTIGAVTPYHTVSGVFAMRVLLARAMGDQQSLLPALSSYILATNQPCPNLDITLGKAGVILTSAYLFEALTDKTWAEQSGLLEMGDRLVAELWQTIDSYQPIDIDCELRNLGMAHGWAGLLYATLRWHEATGAQLPLNLVRRLDELADQAEASGRGQSWLWELGQEEMRMSGWCNGSSGYVYLWVAAHRLLKNGRYRDLAVRAGWHVWEETAVVSNLCCGLAGRSYSLLHLHKLTGDNKWQQRSQILAQKAASHLPHNQTPEYKGFEMSLYKGELGVALLLADLEQPESAVFPFFESEFV